MVQPSVSDIVHSGVIPNFPGGFNNDMFFFLMANIGTTIAPWMIFFQQSSVVDKSLKERDIPWGRLDTAVGAFATVLVAVFIIITTGSVLKGSAVEDAAQAAVALTGVNTWIGTFMAIGLFDAGFLGAICISLASSWAFGEVFGWAHSLNNKIREAPWFYGSYLLLLGTAGTVVLLPGAPLVLITLFVQVIATTLLPGCHGIPDPSPERQGENGRVQEYKDAEHPVGNRGRGHRDAVHDVRGDGALSESAEVGGMHA